MVTMKCSISWLAQKEENALTINKITMDHENISLLSMERSMVLNIPTKTRNSQIRGNNINSRSLTIDFTVRVLSIPLTIQ